MYYQLIHNNTNNGILSLIVQPLASKQISQPTKVFIKDLLYYVSKLQQYTVLIKFLY